MKKQYFRILIIILFVIPIVLFSTNPIAFLSRNENQDKLTNFKKETPQPSFANIWVPNGSAICTADEKQYFPQICTDGAGGAIITWMDNRSGEYDIYAQRIDLYGIVRWGNGQPICLAPGVQENPQICSDGAGGAIITWRDSRYESNYGIYAMRVGSTGRGYWDEEICTADGKQNYPQICSDGAGGAIITWGDPRSGSNWELYAQKINSSGDVQWTPNGTAICTANNKKLYPQICSDGAGGAIVTWPDMRNGLNSDIYAQKINFNGDIQWTPNGTAICTLDKNQGKVQICSDGAGGAIITWRGSRSESWDICAQKIDSSGEVQWTTDGIPICTESESQDDPQICSDGAGGAIITWDDGRSGADGIYAQRVDSNGITQWTANGTAICTASGGQGSSQICSDRAGGAIITWHDSRNYGSTLSDIFAQKVDSSGEVQWSIDGVPICTASESQNSPRICSNEAGGAIITWRDYRSENYDIYAQCIKEHPLITINLPINNQLFEMTAPSFNIEVVELNLATMWYTIDGGATKIPITELIGEINQTEWNKKGNGTVSIEFCAEDIFGLISSAEITVHKDILAPIIIIEDPDPNQEFGEIPPSYVISITEGNLDKIWYTLDDGLTNVYITNLSGTIDESIWEGISQGSVTIRFSASDTLGHIDSKEVSVVKTIESKEKDNFWEDLLQQGILIPIVGAIVGGIVGIFVKITYSRMKKKKALRKSNKT